MIGTISVIETRLKSALAGLITDWPIRWPNELWPATIALNEANLPINASDGSPRPYVEAEVIAGADSADIAPAGQRHSTRDGLFRIYLVVGQGAGLSEITGKADVVANYFKRLTVYLDESTGTRLVTMDVRVDDGVATVVDGDRFVRQCSMNFILDYYS